MSLTARKLQQDRTIAMASDTIESTASEPIAPQRANHVFDPWLRYDHPLIEALAENIGLNIYLESTPRKRNLKQRDADNLIRAVSSLLTNIAFALAAGYSPPSVAISLGASKRKLSRYDAQGFAILPRVVEVLAAHTAGRRTFTLQKSSKRGFASIIVPGPEFMLLAPLGRQNESETIPSRRFPLASFYQAPGGETIILARTERDYVQNTRLRELIDYQEGTDSPSVRYRDEMETINAFLATADMRIEKDGGPPVPTGCRRLQRFFSLLEGDDDNAPRFDQGGRLFGGWWQGLPKARRSAIRLAGEPITDLDFSSMFLRLAYIAAGHVPPEGDLYANISGLSDPQWRDGVKTIVNAMLFRTTPLTRLPRDADLKRTLPADAKGSEVRAAILAAHPLIAGIFESGAGFGLMFRESQILVAALLKLIAENVPVLPMHDGMMVPQSKQGVARRCMEEAAREVTGYTLPITLKLMTEFRSA